MIDSDDVNTLVRVLLDVELGKGIHTMFRQDLSIWTVARTDETRWEVVRTTKEKLFSRYGQKPPSVSDLASSSTSASVETDEDVFFRILKAVKVKQLFVFRDDSTKQWRIAHPEPDGWVIRFVPPQADSDSDSNPQDPTDETTDPSLSRPLKEGSRLDAISVRKAFDELGQTVFPTYKPMFKFIKAREHIPVLPRVKSGYYCYFNAPTKCVRLQFRLYNCKAVGWEAVPEPNPQKMPLSNDLWEKINAVLKRHGIEVEL